MRLNGDEDPWRGRALAISIAALLVGATAFFFFPGADPPDGEGTVVRTEKFKAGRWRGQPVALVELPDGKQILAVMPKSAGPCEEGSRVTLVKDGMRSVIVSNSCAPY